MQDGKDITALSASELSRLIADGRLTPPAVMAGFLDRIEELNPRLNAIVSLRQRAELMAEAEAAADRPATGWLSGLPLAPKDLLATKGLRTTWGSPIFADFVPDEDDLVAARMRAAGGIFIGKTNSPEWGLGSHTFNDVFGLTRNPWNTERSAGGSSGGAAAALAAGMLPVADGSDMMGSLRNPAAFCNVWGFRPSWGLVPAGGPGEQFMATMATEGPMGRTVEDMAHLLAVMAGPAAGAPFDRPAQDYPALLDAPVAGLRIGWLGDWGGAYPCEPGIVELCRAALDRMGAMGCRIVDLAPPFPAERLWESWRVLRAFLNAGSRAALYADPAKRALLKPEAIWEIELGQSITTAQLYEASTIRSDWYARVARLFDEVDFIALPSAQVWPFDAALRYPAEVGGKALDTYYRWMEVVLPVTLAGLPCVSMPVGFGAEGLPMGMQLAGPIGADAAVLALGHAWDRAEDYPGMRRPPLTGG
ncbi:amidase [Paracoccus pacificus]|uniref:Amidase n=1 Tax=Paracoccus pacificus TaxID=1463598 RepID=A0ABW4R7Y2_9RHOB